MRDLIISKICDMLLQSEYYGDYVRGFGEYAQKRHAEILASLERANDRILLSLYSKILLDMNIVPCAVDSDGNYADVYVNYGYGGMVSDGTVHT